MKPLILLGLLFGIGFINSAYAQTINVNSTQPCFLNYTAGADMWRNCGIEDDYLKFVILPWNWITGGYFSMFFVIIIVIATWLKYHKAIYPILIGTFYLPISAALFPQQFMMYAILFSGIAIFITVWYVFIKQTREY